jgi:hypothetical protein
MGGRRGSVRPPTAAAELHLNVVAVNSDYLSNASFVRGSEEVAWI